MVGVKVDVKNIGAGVHCWEAVTGMEDAYPVLSLPIGNYSVTVEREGFMEGVTSPQPLETNQSLRIDVRMKVGAVSQTVTIAALAERVPLAFRAEFFNVLNHTEWQNPTGGLATFFSPQLGQITSTYDPRIGQLSLRLTFYPQQQSGRY